MIKASAIRARRLRAIEALDERVRSAKQPRALCLCRPPVDDNILALVLVDAIPHDEWNRARITIIDSYIVIGGDHHLQWARSVLSPHRVLGDWFTIDPAQSSYVFVFRRGKSAYSVFAVLGIELDEPLGHPFSRNSAM